MGAGRTRVVVVDSSMVSAWVSLPTQRSMIDTHTSWTMRSKRYDGNNALLEGNLLRRISGVVKPGHRESTDPHMVS
jgi:hypothetical protein